jgi:hypothetical protein
MRLVSMSMVAVLLVGLAAGCSSQQSTALKEGEKFPFPPPTPPADWIKERMRLRDSAQSGKPGTQPAPGAQPPAQR